MLLKVIETLASPKAWTKGAYARTAKGRVIGPECQNAECFCMQGALIRADPKQSGRWNHFLYRAISDLFPQRSRSGAIALFNDHRDTTHVDVLQVLHRARELELAAGPDVPVARNVTLPADTPIPPEALATLTAG